MEFHPPSAGIGEALGSRVATPASASSVAAPASPACAVSAVLGARVPSGCGGNPGGFEWTEIAINAVEKLRRVVRATSGGKKTLGRAL